MSDEVSVRIKKLEKLLPQAGNIFLNHLENDDLGVEEKDTNDFVTKADKEIEKLLTENLRNEFPNDSVLGEEYGNLDGASEFKWIIDPIDGSNNYARKIADARITVALMRCNTIVYGIIYNPKSYEVYLAQLGLGANLRNLKTGEEKILTVSNRPFSQSMVIYTAGLAKGDNQSLSILRNLVGKIESIRLYGSAAIAFELIASGRADCFICNIAKPMDMVAGYLIAREAGGEVLNFSGNNWSPNDTDILVVNKTNAQNFLQSVYIPKTML